jgi:hypothetical protein
MPNPSAPPPQRPDRAVPQDLDSLFRKAMVGGSTKALERALEDTREEAPPPPAQGPPSVPGSLPELVQELVQKAHEPPPVRRESPRKLYEAMLETLQRAEPLEGDLRASELSLRQAREQLDRLLEALGQLAPLPPVVLPPFRQAFALFLQAPGDAERAQELATALELDLPTARMVAMSRHPRVALRSGDRRDLERRAESYRRALGLEATVLDQAALLAQPRARAALLLDPAGPWQVTSQHAWELDPDRALSLPAEPMPPPTLSLVVVGEVQVRRFRKAPGRRKRDEDELTATGERRMAVVDLHHDKGVLRVSEGRTDLGPWPGLDRRSSTLAVRGLVEWLAENAPCPVLARRTCQPQRQPIELDDGSFEAAGWPAFEEHSRACRILFGL